jgi:hypothetical protein
MTLDKHFSKDIVSLLLASGYLKVTQKIDFNKYKIEIVNNEIRQTYKNLISKYVKDSAGVDIYAINSLVLGFKKDKINRLYRNLKEISKNVHTFLKKFESSYHSTLFALLSLDNSINVKCEVDAGDGRIDLVIYFDTHKCLIEIKKCIGNEDPEEKFIDLLDQVEDEEYRSIMEPQDTIYGIVFTNDDVIIRKI